MRVAGDLQAVAREALPFEHAHLFDQDLRIHNDPVADDRYGVFVHDARGNEVQRELLVAAYHGMSGVVATLIADDEIEFAGDEVRDLALAFVTPLRADQNYV